MPLLSAGVLPERRESLEVYNRTLDHLVVVFAYIDRIQEFGHRSATSQKNENKPDFESRRKHCFAGRRNTRYSTTFFLRQFEHVGRVVVFVLLLFIRALRQAAYSTDDGRESSLKRDNRKGEETYKCLGCMYHVCTAGQCLVARAKKAAPAPHGHPLGPTVYIWGKKDKGKDQQRDGG